MVNYTYDKALKVKNRPKLINGRETVVTERKRGFCTKIFIEFCKRTDLHGYKYIVMEDLNAFERCLWALAVVVSISSAAYFVVTAYKWYARNPIVTVIESTQGAVWDIPFPSVTICDLNAISRTAARSFANNLTLPDNITADEVFKIVRLAPLLHSSFPVNPAHKLQLNSLQSVLDLNHISIEKFLRQLSPASSCNQLIHRCMWKNTIYRCDVLFRQVFTHFSLCCAFNYYATDMDHKKSSFDDMQQPEKPRRVASCGYQTALTIILNVNPGDYHSTPVASQGALVLIDNAYNLPNVDSPIRMVNPSTEVLIALSPESTYATPGVRNFQPLERLCYYNDEVQIANFRQYSFHNCIAFQRVDIIKSLCECIPFYFPLKDYHRTCNFNDLDCLESVRELEKENPDQENKIKEEEFRCLPECEHFDYPLEVAFGRLASNIRRDGMPFLNDVTFENRSVVNVFFNDLVSTRYRRDVYLNWQNLLASFGGLLSLMLGFTLIAGFDLILFCTFGMAYGSITTALNDHHMKTNHSNTKVVQRNKITFQEFPKKSNSIDNLKNKMLIKEFGKGTIVETRYGNFMY